MNNIASIESLFTVVTDIQEAGKIYSHSETVPLQFCQTLVKLDDLEEALQNEHTYRYLISLLSLEEKKLFSIFTYPKRRREWLGGRLAAKSAVLQLLQIDSTIKSLPELSILPKENGSPQLSSSLFDEDKLPALSISHSNRFAVAMATKATSCGIDIQKISEKTERVADRFSEPDELLLLQNHTPLLNTQERLTLLWSAKEALKKALLHDQPVIFQGVVLHSMNVNQHYTLHLHFPNDLNRPAEVTAMLLEDCVLAYTTAKACHA